MLLQTLNTIVKAMYLFYVTMYSPYYFYTLLVVFFLPWVFTFVFTSICYDGGIFQKCMLTAIIMLNLYDLVVMGRIKSDVQDYLFDIPRFVLLL